MPQARPWSLPARVALAISFAVLVAIAGAAQQQQPPPSGPPGGFSNNFTGKVTVVESKDVRISRIRFEAGARTNWHVHTAPQVLVAEEGQGRFQEKGGDVKTVGAGEPAYLRANTVHWHGAAPDQAIVQLSMYAGELKWMEPVTDDEYSGKKK